MVEREDLPTSGEEDDDDPDRAAQAGDRRPAQCGQVDPGQHDARRGADDHRPRSRDHARFDQPRLGVGGPRRCGWSTPRACASAPRSRTSSSGCRSPTPAGRSIMPKSSCCCSTPPAASKSQDLRIADQVIEEGRALIIAVNKWDVAEHASSLFNGIKARARRGAGAAARRAAADRLGQDRQGHRHHAQGRVRPARGVEQARSRPASSTAGSSARSRPIRRPRPAASGSSCATSPRSNAARRPSSCSATAPTSCPKAIAAICSTRCAATSGSARCRCGSTSAARRNPFDTKKQPLSQILPFRAYCWPVEPCPSDRGHGNWTWTTRGRTSSTGRISRAAGPSSGPGFIRILGYFKEDGVKSIAQIEQAMREQNTAALVLPAHTLKGESRQLGAEPLAEIAELIESTARFCVETHRFPDELVPAGGRAAPAVQRDGRARSTRRPTRC